MKVRWWNRWGWKSRVAIACLMSLMIVAAIGWRPLYVAWQLRGAREALRLAEPEAALTILKSVERLHPDRTETLYLLARAHRRAGHIDRAISYLERAAEQGGLSKEIRHQSYLLLIQTGQFEKAEPYLQNVLRQTVRDELAEEIYEAQAKGYLHTYRFSDALLCLNYWIQWRSEAIRPRMWRAEVRGRLEQWKTAAVEYKAILKIDPNHYEAHCRLGDCLFNLNDIRSALRQYQECLKSQPDHVEARIGIAKCQRRLAGNENIEAEFWQLLALQLTPEQRAGVLTELGQLALEKRASEEAIELLTEALQSDPLNSLTQHTLGTAYLKNGQPGRAEQHFAQAQRINKRFSRLTDITRQLIREPQDADLRWEAGKLLMEQGFRKEGAAWMGTALMHDPDHRPSHESLAEYYASINNRRLANHHRELAENSGSRSRSEEHPP